ncbi:hypothetical protein [Crassaminicella profunda]|uniref:hypothetical protein n=1 Tax=Crassaminicella profunda TaxID=1286698 RepID=UPI001CA790F4|nr:hypothetical protein [Crassaminicella profunda]QZY55002.1 hypothetical protein K7H06_18620 [Crassaminicella profunda]
MKTRPFIIIFLLIFLVLLTSCVEHKNLNPNEIAIVNGDAITREDVEKKLATFQLEKNLYEYNGFQNNIYRNLELLHLRRDLIDDIIHLLKEKKLEDAKNFISSLKNYEDLEALKYFLLKEIDHYEQILNKQDNVITAFEETLKDLLILQEAKANALIPTESELQNSYTAYLLSIQEKIDTNIYYKCFHAFCESKEKELFHLDTEEAYKAYELQKIKKELIMQKLKNEIGSYHLDSYITNQLSKSTIILNKKYNQYTSLRK